MAYNVLYFLALALTLIDLIDAASLNSEKKKTRVACSGIAAGKGGRLLRGTCETREDCIYYMSVTENAEGPHQCGNWSLFFTKKKKKENKLIRSNLCC